MPNKCYKGRFFYLLINIFRERGHKDISATWRASNNATSMRPSRHSINAKKKRASIQPSPHPSGALLGLKPSRIIHLITFIVRHAVLIYSSTPLNAVHI